MDRLEQIRKFISKTDKGIELAPWFAPIASKRDGYDCCVLDYFDTAELQNRAAIDPNIPKDSLPLIEPVDFVGSAVEIATLVKAKAGLGKFDYIISSHNFEHLPNPIRFLQGCQEVLKSGGVLSMAIPDHRACFDHFRPHTVIADWLQAYFENRSRPTAFQTFSQNSYSSELKNPPGRETAFYVEDNAADIIPNEQLHDAYANLVKQVETADTAYIDTHCSVLTASSFELLILECRFLGLINFEIKDIAGPSGCEFFVHLENTRDQGQQSKLESEFYEKRKQLIHRVADEIAQASPWGWSMLHSQTRADYAPGQPINMASLAERLDRLETGLMVRLDSKLNASKIISALRRRRARKKR